MTLLLSILLLIPILLIAIFDIGRDIKKGVSKRSLTATFIFWLFYSASAFLSYYAFKVNPAYGIAQYSVVLAVSILALLNAIFNYVDKINSLPPLLVLLVLIVSPVVMFIVVIPVAVIPAFETDSYTKTLITAEGISPEPIVANLSRIKESIQELEYQLMLESQNIDSLSTAIVAELEKSNEELTRISEQRDEIVYQLEYAIRHN